MAYDKTVIFEKSKKLIQQHNLFFIEDIVAFLPCDKTTFYKFFPPDSNELNEIKDLLEENKVNLKVKMRKKWSDSDNATLQMALMKIICTDEERKKLAMNYNESEVQVNTAPIVIDWTTKE